MSSSQIFDLSLYGAIGGLTAYVGYTGTIDARAIATFVLGALIAIKAKRSAGSEDPPAEA